MINLPDFCVVLLVGPSGCGKSTFAAKHFLPTEVLSSDYCRGLVSDDENDQSATEDAFDVLYYILAKRLKERKLTVIDATNVQIESRKGAIALAREFHALVFAIVFNFPEEICQERNKSRPNRQFGNHVVRNQLSQLKRSMRGLGREGIRQSFFFRTPEELERAEFERAPLWCDKRVNHGPFDIIGDVHGCYDELCDLLDKLGWKRDGFKLSHPERRLLVLLGDLVDRGPRTPDVLKLAMQAVEDGIAFCVPGNHDIKLVRKLSGRDVQVAHGLAETLEQLEPETDEFKAKVRDFLDGLVSHQVLDDGKLVVAHAGMKEEYQNRGSGRVREFALFGETTGETDDFGLPIRYNWAAEYRGQAMVVYGHTPVPEPEWLNRTINIDTGCVFGGNLTALRYPEREIIQVESRALYAQPSKPFLEEAPELSAQHELDDVLDLEDVVGKRIVHTRLRGNITIREENASAALEAMSRFAANPKWLIYLPPTMSPSETSNLEGYLEHPVEAFEQFRAGGVAKVVCEEKHMGSRAVAILCRNEEAVKRKFGLTSGELGIIYTRTGRRFFDDLSLERALLVRVSKAMETAGTWDALGSDWVVLDCELMPWSAKAQELLVNQYAPLGVAAGASLATATRLLDQAGAIEGLKEIRTNEHVRKGLVDLYIQAYLQYCWPVRSIEDLRLAPFHILASEGHVHADKNHEWHMDTIASFAALDPVLVRTPYRIVDLLDSKAVDEGVNWWMELTKKGGEGMVVKPFNFVETGPRGLIQPAIKCRGREYLRIIYGPEYSLPGHLDRLRRRGLSTKRSLALREFALGIEGLERFVRNEPLRRVHECSFAVLAMESEPVDPRL